MRKRHSAAMRWWSVLGAAFFSFTLVSQGYAAGLVRDAEIEWVLQRYTQPIFEAAGIPARDVRLLVVDDPSLNAFVAGGMNLFVHTGMLRSATKPAMLLGVLAHETGHIAGAHLSQLSETSSRVTLGAALGAVVGMAAIAGGAGQAGAGVLMGSGQLSRNVMSSHIRVNEQAADQAAIHYLESAGISPSGMLEMFEILRREEASHNIQKNPFLRDHPLTSERIATLRRAVDASSMAAGHVPAEFEPMHARMLAKLTGFSDPYDRILQRYPLSDTSLPARYARAIGNFRRGHLQEALTQMDGLIRAHPLDPYFYDTKGQMLFEHGRVLEAADAYRLAAQYAPNSALILTDYARSLVAQEQPSQLARAEALLEQSRLHDDSYALTWRTFAIIYGKQGKMGLSYLALAEEAALSGDADGMLQHLARARHYAQKDPALELKISDLEVAARALRDAKREQRGF